MALCQFYATPSPAERGQLGITDEQIVLGCPREQGPGPLFFFVPVEGGAVRAAVCPEHADYLASRYRREQP